LVCAESGDEAVDVSRFGPRRRQTDSRTCAVRGVRLDRATARAWPGMKYEYIGHAPTVRIAETFL
jgi:hypothetical protein